MKELLRIFIAVAAVVLFFQSCKKNGDEDNCEQIQKVRISTSKTSYYTGDTIILKMTLIPPISLITWGRGQTSNQTWNDETVVIYRCTKNDQGWYYLNVSYPGCPSANDSVYISVENNPAAPTCTTSDNVAIFSSIPNINFTSTTWGPDPNMGARLLRGISSGDQDMNIYFNPYWNSIEPEDGAYNIYNISDFYSTDDKYSVYMVSGYSGILFTASPGKLYVTHENQKLKVTFCSVSFTAVDGFNTFSTSATGSVIAP